MGEKGTLMKKLMEANRDFEERLRTNDIRVGYDDEHDMLFITIGPPQEAITEEVSERLHFRFDPDSDKIVGITITAFKKAFLREHQDFKRDFETVFERRTRIEAWEFVPQTEASEEAFEYYRNLVEIGNEALGGKVKVYAGEVSGLRQVLSILDEWELVAEGPLTNLLATRISDLIERNVYKGDTIAIYRRKKDESDS